VKLNWKALKRENLKEAINKVVGTVSYTKNAERVSKRFRDKPEKPLDRAVWWIEYILRNPNSTHLQSPTVKLGVFLSNSYDILVFLSTIFLLVSYLVLKISLWFLTNKRVE
jgi:glucuronosyltransferase